MSETCLTQKTKFLKNEKHSFSVAKVPDMQGIVHYDLEEHRIWNALIKRHVPLVKQNMVTLWQDGADALDVLPRNGESKPIPSAVEISDKLQKKTGWRLEAVPAVIGFERFYEMLSEKIFPAASFIRRWEDVDDVEDPDIFHEIFGHAPLLAHPAFAEFCQGIGEAGAKCMPKDRAWPIRLFWFSMAFGLMREKGAVKALGTGLARMVEEMQ